MELLEYKNELMKMLEISKLQDLPGALEARTGDKNFRKQYLHRFGDRDWIRELYQYYLADREGLKQDYTPSSLAALCSALVGRCQTIADLCAGSGSLSIHADAEHIEAIELDDRVLPFLRFNLFLHQKDATVTQANVLEAPVNQVDGVISNPPFNLPYDGEDLSSKTGNWAFVYKALQVTKGRAVIILPNSVLTESKDREAVERLIELGYLEAVIGCPGKMFDSTSIPVCLIVVNAHPSGQTVFVDACTLADKEVREQRGQFGGNSHTGRIYKKEINVFSDQAIDEICRLINERESGGNSAVIDSDFILQNDCNLKPNLYIKKEEPEDTQSKLEWIANQYNRIIRTKNACKLTINETLAKELNFDQSLWEESKKQSADVAAAIQKVSGVKLEKEDYLTFTRSRELSIRFKSKEELPAIFSQFIQLWINQTVLLNQMENAMLAEMRDYLLPLLMERKIVLEG